MTKAPEEGQIWEWRAFGQMSDALIARVRAHPIRMGIKDAAAEDVYLISPGSDQNVKLRQSGGQWVLKFKLLLKKESNGMELYSESSNMIFSFPVGLDRMSMAEKLLAVTLPEAELSVDSFDRERFIDIFKHASPAAKIIEVSKVRSQFDMNIGWIELADMKFPHGQSQSISLHSADMKSVEAMMDELKPDAALEVMNYVEACRRWG
jgi:hypothetical protein